LYQLIPVIEIVKNRSTHQRSQVYRFLHLSVWHWLDLRDVS